MGRCIPPPPPPRAMGCNRNRPDINTTTVGGRGGGLGGCVYRLSLPRHGGPEGGGGVWEMDIRDPPWAQANFPPPQDPDLMSDPLSSVLLNVLRPQVGLGGGGGGL